MANYTLGTILPAADFNAEAACGIFKKAVKGFSTDSASIIEVLCRHSGGQRQAISTQFKSSYGEDLYELMRKELSGHFRTVVLSLLTPLRELEALCLYKAGADRTGTLEDVFIEIIASRTKRELEEIKAAYKEVSVGRTELDSDIVGETSGDFKLVLRALLAGGREDDGDEDEALAAKDAEVLYKVSTIALPHLCRRGKPASVPTKPSSRGCSARGAYRSCVQPSVHTRDYGKDILTVINEETSGDLRKTYYAIALCAINRPRYFAELFKQSMEGLGTNDNLLIRLVVTRCEIDLVEIKEEFATLCGKSLIDWIKDDTSGNYMNILVNVCAGQGGN